MMPLEALLGHQGGWDEVLYIAVPVVLAIVAIRWLERRNRNGE